MQKLKTQKQLLMEAMWKKAWHSPDGLEVTFQTKAGATRARMALYNAVRKAKNGMETDQELVSAAQGMDITWTGEMSFRLRHLDQADFIQGLEASLGEKLSEQMDPVLKESLRRVEELTKPKDISIPHFGERVDPFGIFGSKDKK